MTSSVMVVVGRVGKSYGVKGWMKVQSFTAPITNLLDYSPWYLEGKAEEWLPCPLLEAKTHGGGLVIQLEGCTTPEEVKAYTGKQIAVSRDQLPELPEGEYYWCDLIGLAVQTVEGQALGTVERLMDTGGANDVLVVQGERERLIPFVVGHHVVKVDFDDKLITVDWDPEF